MAFSIGGSPFLTIGGIAASSHWRRRRSPTPAVSPSVNIEKAERGNT
jgi:hypothetical protein